jgi:hypothetical protein
VQLRMHTIAWVIKRLDPGNTFAKIRMHPCNVRRQLVLVRDGLLRTVVESTSAALK